MKSQESFEFKSHAHVKKKLLIVPICCSRRFILAAYSPIPVAVEFLPLNSTQPFAIGWLEFGELLWFCGLQRRCYRFILPNAQSLWVYRWFIGAVGYALQCLAAHSQNVKISTALLTWTLQKGHGH